MEINRLKVFKKGSIWKGTDNQRERVWVADEHAENKVLEKENKDEEGNEANQHPAVGSLLCALFWRALPI